MTPPQKVSLHDPSTFQRHPVAERFSRGCVRINGPGCLCWRRGSDSYALWVLSLTTRPSWSNYDIIKHDLKPNVRVLPSEQKQLLK